MLSVLGLGLRERYLNRASTSCNVGPVTNARILGTSTESMFPEFSVMSPSVMQSPPRGTWVMEVPGDSACPTEQKASSRNRDILRGVIAASVTSEEKDCSRETTTLCRIKLLSS